VAAVGSVCFVVAACGSAGTASAPRKQVDYPVRVSATFPSAQRLAQHTDLVVTVTNSGNRVMPDVAVTITNPKYGTGADALATLIPAKAPAGQQPLANRSRPVWVIARAPGPCAFSCRSGGGPGGADTPYANTWALGRLAPGQTARFDWGVTAVRAGSYAVAYRVAAGLDSGQRAVLAGGEDAAGTLDVKVSAQPAPQHFTSTGQIASGS